MLRYTFRTAIALSALVAVIAGCSNSANPARPSGVSSSAASAASTGQPSPAELTARGWSCFVPPPFPTRTVCSHPNQGFPAIPPPADRPATFNLWLYENGQFVGTELLIRPDLYCGADVSDPTGACTREARICQSTGKPYTFAAVIGYYECVHATGH
jgi:hypothetical protein